MSFDNSRSTFNPCNDYAGVVMQQGRVQLDADWNEWLSEFARRMQAGTLDILGRAVYPATTPYAFQITASSSGGSNLLTIGPGRMYVDGLLAENHGDPTTAVWDPALAETSNTPQPPPATESGAISYTAQPYMPPGTSLPGGNGPFLAYLDVWVRPVDFLNDPNLIDKAVGIDSTGRLQIAWQVKLLDLSNDPGATCTSNISGWPPPASTGLLTTGTTPTPLSGPCCLTAGTAYTGMENQFYRVEIHQPGVAEGSAVPPTGPSAGIATFKWSRDNGSVITGVSKITNVTNSLGNPASQLAVQSLGRDQVLGFAPGNWIEIIDDGLEFGGLPGELHQIDTVDFSAKTITLATKLSGFSSGVTDPTRHTRIRRWDQSGKVYEADGKTVWWDIDAQAAADIPVPPSGTSLILESGIIVSFDESTPGGAFLTRDFWNFAARTADGSVEILHKAPPRGLHHHYARLAIVTFPSSATDCRTPWHPGTGSQQECGCCCTCTVGDGVDSVGQFTSINAAISALPDSGGEVCILPGRYVENVFIQGKHDIVLRGCGWQTRLASQVAGAAPGGGPALKGAPASSSSSVFHAVITVTASQHVKLLSFAVEAAKDNVGILLDGIGDLGVPQQPPGSQPQQPASADVRSVIIEPVGVIDVTIDDLVITASTMPAVLAARIRLLQIEANRVAMANVASKWPAIWVSGIEMRLLHNWVGIQSLSADREFLPVTVQGDLANDASGFTSAGGVPINPGGIQIAGPSTDVFVIENEIDSAGRNGITLGSVEILDTNGNSTGPTGVTIILPGPCDTTITLQIDGTPSSDGGGGSVVSAGKLLNIKINRNRIRNTGLCGIGPVGFFNLVQALEIITIENLTITANIITRSVLRELAAFTKDASLFGYAAICVPDVSTLNICDNSITDFGQQPGDDVCGIFVLHGEMVEISRNQVTETRDWQGSQKDAAPAGGLRGGIAVLLATPPTLTSTASPYVSAAGFAAAYLPPVYLPALPALTVEHNVVRVPLGRSFEAYGYGPFRVVNNHFGCGGTLRTSSGRPLGETVLIMNLSAALEATSSAGTFLGTTKSAPVFGTTNAAQDFAPPSSGVVLFTNNLCHLETRLSRRQCFASVVLLSLDDIIFGHNHCWLDGPSGTAFLDALILAGSVDTTSNRFQESLDIPVLASGFTIGGLNITSQNISTYCLLATGTLQPAIDNNNLSLVSSQICSRLSTTLKLNNTQ